MDDRNTLIEIFDRAGFQCDFEYTYEGELVIVRNRYNGYAIKLTFDGEGKLVSMDKYFIA